jgi:hypothetical protein
MTISSNRLCSASLKNNNPLSPIESFSLVTVREYNDYEGGTYIDEVRTSAEFLEKDRDAYDDPFYQIYGSRRIDVDGRPGTVFLGEFHDIDKALNFLYYITGEHAQVISY